MTARPALTRRRLHIDSRGPSRFDLREEVRAGWFVGVAFLHDPVTNRWVGLELEVPFEVPRDDDDALRPEPLPPVWPIQSGL